MENVIYAYTRKQAVEDGEQVDVSTTAAEAGIRFPVFLTRRVFDAYVTVPPNVAGQDEAGRLWDIVWMLRSAIKSGRSDGDRIAYSLYVPTTTAAPGLCNWLPPVAHSTWTRWNRPSPSCCRARIDHGKTERLDREVWPFFLHHCRIGQFWAIPFAVAQKFPGG